MLTLRRLVAVLSIAFAGVSLAQSSKYPPTGGGGGGTVTSVGTTAPLTGGPITTSGTIGIPAATSLADGYLSSADWSTFNAKQAAGSYALTSETISTTAPLTGGGNLSAPRTIAIPAATSLANGYLSSADWSTFNAKQPAGSYAASGANSDITSLTGLLTPLSVPQGGTGDGSFTSNAVVVGNGTGPLAVLANNSTITQKFLAQASSAPPVWSVLVSGDIPNNAANTTGTASNVTATSNSTLTTLSALSLPGAQVTGNISGNAANITGTAAVTNGGTGDTSFTSNAIVIGNSTSPLAVIANNATIINKFLTQSSSAAPVWNTLGIGDLPSIQYPSESWVAAEGGSDAGDGSFQHPWKTLAFAATQVSGNNLIHLTGRTDTSAGAISVAPGTYLVADYPGFQINQAVTITGGAGNGQVTLVNLQLFSTLSWTRSDATAMQLWLLNVEVDDVLTLHQDGSGVAGAFLWGRGAILGGGVDARAGAISLTGGQLGTLTYVDSGTAFLNIEAVDTYGAIALNGGISATFTGSLVETGTTITGATTGSGTPSILTDSGRVQDFTTGSFTLVGNATSTASGYLSFADWITFNAKQPAISATAGSALFSGGGNVVSQDNANFFWDSTNKRLGIGTATPASSLDVVGGDIHLEPNGGADSYKQIFTAGNGTDSMRLRNYGGNRGWVWTANGVDSMYLNQDGLLVSSGGLNTPSISGLGSLSLSAANAQIVMNNNGGVLTRLVYQDGGVDKFYVGINSADDYNITPDGVNFPLYIQRASNNVGIGTNAPGAKLEIRNGHQKSTQTTAPTAVPTANAGTGATCTVTNATDTAGTINLTTTAIASASGDVCDVTFNLAYGVAPICMLTPVSANAILDAVVQGVFLSTATTALSINFANTDVVGRTYNWAYSCIETQ